MRDDPQLAEVAARQEAEGREDAHLQVQQNRREGAVEPLQEPEEGKEVAHQ